MEKRKAAAGSPPVHLSRRTCLDCGTGARAIPAVRRAPDIPAVPAVADAHGFTETQDTLGTPEPSGFTEVAGVAGVAALAGFTGAPGGSRVAGVPVVAGVSEIFRVLGDETRCRIVHMLSVEELCTCELAEALGITMPAVSHHLRLLRALRLVKTRPQGKHVFYALADHHIVGLINLAQEHYDEER
ncbi:MAG: metalloregulator ArsR/SmtB family transcription factor [Clostridia bacterium]|nr:metalloregulator ArsR/SmtB family transcription factor [Clostridia bacterium]